MAVSSGISFILASVSTVLIFSAMQLYRPWLASSQLSTVLGGYLGSVLFTFILTAIGNIESVAFGKSFQSKLFPEVIVCLLISMIAAGMVHRVCATTCLLFSLVSLYYMNLLSQKIHTVAHVPQVHIGKKKK